MQAKHKTYMSQNAPADNEMNPQPFPTKEDKMLE